MEIKKMIIDPIAKKLGIEMPSGERRLTEAEEAILAVAKPETEAEALAVLSAANEDNQPERGCKHIFQGRCQLHNIAADDECRCSRWE